MKVTDEQQYIINESITWLIKNSKNAHITIGGYAGTGKTFLISQIRKQIYDMFPHNFSVGFVTFTGKASFTLRSRLKEEESLFIGDTCGTIHSLIYKPEVEWNKKEKRMIIKRWIRKDKDEITHSAIIIDEASMVSSKIWNDLKSYDIPIIAVGDHGQLPPIGDNFSLMSNLDYKLTQIHRQSLQSGIIPLSAFVRKNGYIPPGKYTDSVFKLDWNTDLCQKIWNNIDFLNDDVICICGFNQSRVNINNLIRKKLTYTNIIPYPNERIVCLRNNSESGIFNGQIGTVSWVMPPNKSKNICKMTIQFDGVDEFYDGDVSLLCFGKVAYGEIDEPKYITVKGKRKRVYNKGDFFDYGYTISVHKSQASEFDKVVMFEQRSRYWDDEYYRRWLYTGITRAKKKLMVISNYY